MTKIAKTAAKTLSIKSVSKSEKIAAPIKKPVVRVKAASTATETVRKTGEWFDVKVKVGEKAVMVPAIKSDKGRYMIVRRGTRYFVILPTTKETPLNTTSVVKAKELVEAMIAPKKIEKAPAPVKKTVATKVSATTAKMPAPAKTDKTEKRLTSLRLLRMFENGETVKATAQNVETLLRALRKIKNRDERNA